MLFLLPIQNANFSCESEMTESRNERCDLTSSFLTGIFAKHTQKNIEYSAVQCAYTL